MMGTAVGTMPSRRDLRTTRGSVACRNTINAVHSGILTKASKGYTFSSERAFNRVCPYSPFKTSSHFHRPFVHLLPKVFARHLDTLPEICITRHNLCLTSRLARQSHACHIMRVSRKDDLSRRDLVRNEGAQRDTRNRLIIIIHSVYTLRRLRRCCLRLRRSRTTLLVVYRVVLKEVGVVLELLFELSQS